MTIQYPIWNSKDRYDISLIDIEMDELDGFETIKKAREKNKGHRLYDINNTYGNE